MACHEAASSASSFPVSIRADVDDSSTSTRLTSPILLYDGTCGFCAESVQFVLARDPGGGLRFAALDSTTGRGIIERHPEVRGFDSVLFVEPAAGAEPERIFAHSDAALRVAAYLGGPWGMLRLTRIVPSSLRNAIYRLIARHRHRLTSGAPRCVIPAERDRARFVD